MKGYRKKKLKPAFVKYYKNNGVYEILLPERNINNIYHNKISFNLRLKNFKTKYFHNIITNKDDKTFYKLKNQKYYLYKIVLPIQKLTETQQEFLDLYLKEQR